MNRKRSAARHSREKNRIKSEYERFILIAFALVCAAVFRIFLSVPVRIVGDSMYPTFATGNWVVADPMAYRQNEPKRADLVLIRRKELTNGCIVKRVVGLPGETIEIKSGVLYVDGQRINEDYAIDYAVEDFGPVYVENDSYFVLGDNRSESRDSRHWEKTLVTKEELRGKIMYLIFPEVHKMYD